MNFEGTEAVGGMEQGRDAFAADISAGVGAARKSSAKPLIITGLILLILIAVIGGAYWLVTKDQAAKKDGEGDEATSSVTVITPGRSTIAGEIVATGTLAARRELPVGVAGEGGRVVSVPVDAGQWVQAGQILAVVDRSVQNQQVASASAQIDVARSDARLAQANLDRALKLVERGFISKADVDRLTATRDAATARVKAAQAQVGELRARNARLNIVAPEAGLVLARNVEPGQIVSAGSGVLFSIAKGGEMELKALVNEVDLATLATGVAATVTPVGSATSFTGEVWQVSPTIDPNSRQGTARIALVYAEGLRPGGFAKAVIRSGTIVAPMLPESAMMSDEKGAYVYIIDNKNKVVRRPIKTGQVTESGIVVTEGLNGTERVVLRAGGFLTPGQTVDAQKAKQGKS